MWLRSWRRLRPCCDGRTFSMLQLIVLGPDVHFGLELFEVEVKSGPMNPWDVDPVFLNVLALDLVLDGDSHHSFKSVA